MNPVYLVLFIAVCVGIAAMHVLGAFGSARAANVGVTVGLCLHIPLFLLMMLLSWTMDVAVVTFLGSITLYTVLQAVAHKMCAASETQPTEEEASHDV